MQERLQKIIARAGIVSRRKAEEFITAGRVSVNGAVVRELGSRADPATDTVCVDGDPVQQGAARRYLAMNKPKGCITSTSDPEGRTTVMDLLGSAASKGLFPVGRLDYNTEGLLLLTDDGDFSNRILAAKNKVPKTYQVKISGSPPKEAIQRLRDGIRLDGRASKPESIRLLKHSRNPWYEVTIIEGRNRQIHRMFERIGFLVEKIRRVRIGSLTLKGLEPRQVRELEPKEVQRLLAPRPANKPRQTKAHSPSRSGTSVSRRAPNNRMRTKNNDQRADRRETSGRKRGAVRASDGGAGFKQSGRRRQQPSRRQPNGGRSPARAAAPVREASPRRSRPRSPGQRNSRRGSTTTP